MESKVIEYIGYTVGMVGALVSAAIDFLGLNIGISSWTAALCGVVPMVVMSGLSMVFYTPGD